MDKAQVIYKITGKQKELLKDLDEVIIKIIKHCEDDDIFNDFICRLGIFDWSDGDLIELSDKLIDIYSE